MGRVLWQGETGKKLGLTIMHNTSWTKANAIWTAAYLANVEWTCSHSIRGMEVQVHAFHLASREAATHLVKKKKMLEQCLSFLLVILKHYDWIYFSIINEENTKEEKLLIWQLWPNPYSRGRFISLAHNTFQHRQSIIRPPSDENVITLSAIRQCRHSERPSRPITSDQIYSYSAQAGSLLSALQGINEKTRNKSIKR